MSEDVAASFKWSKVVSLHSLQRKCGLLKAELKADCVGIIWKPNQYITWQNIVFACVAIFVFSDHQSFQHCLVVQGRGRFFCGVQYRVCSLVVAIVWIRKTCLAENCLLAFLLTATCWYSVNIFSATSVLSKFGIISLQISACENVLPLQTMLLTSCPFVIEERH